MGECSFLFGCSNLSHIHLQKSGEQEQKIPVMIIKFWKVYFLTQNLTCEATIRPLCILFAFLRFVISINYERFLPFSNIELVFYTYKNKV